MIDFEIIYGLTGVILTLIAVIYGYKTIQNFKEDKEIAIRMLILDKNAKKPFIYLSITLMLFAATSSSSAIFSGNEILLLARRISTILLFSGVAYFAHQIEYTTRKHSKK